MNNIILKILKVFYRYNVACKNLGIINTLKILKARFYKKEYLVKLETKLFGKIYWRSIRDYGVISHFFSPQVKFDKINTDKKIIVDLGANIGIETLRFNYLFPNSKIISVEPDKYSIEQPTASFITWQNSTEFGLTILEGFIRDIIFLSGLVRLV